MLDSFYVYPGPAEPPAADSVEFIVIGGVADVYPIDASAAPDCSFR